MRVAVEWTSATYTIFMWNKMGISKWEGTEWPVLVKYESFQSKMEWTKKFADKR